MFDSLHSTLFRVVGEYMYIMEKLQVPQTLINQLINLLIVVMAMRKRHLLSSKFVDIVHVPIPRENICPEKQCDTQQLIT